MFEKREKERLKKIIAFTVGLLIPAVKSLKDNPPKILLKKINKNRTLKKNHFDVERKCFFFVFQRYSIT